MALIRRDVFKVTHRAFAQISGASQGTVSRWEAGEFEPSRDQLARIREEAQRRGLKWDDAWFFEAPCHPSSEEGDAPLVPNELRPEAVQAEELSP